MIVYKQAIVVRTDLTMSKGKLAAQAAHASVSALEKADKKVLMAWKKGGQKKIVLKAPLAELLQLAEKCKKHHMPHALISDAGLTELTAGEITCLGIGPDEEKRVNKVTGSLPLLR